MAGVVKTPILNWPLRLPLDDEIEEAEVESWSGNVIQLVKVNWLRISAQNRPSWGHRCYFGQRSCVSWGT